MKKELNESIKITGKILDNWLPLKIMYDQTPGVVVCIAVNGVPKYLKAFGLSDLESNIPIKKDAQFRVASMSKMFTAVAILQLQEEGELRIDDKVINYLPWFAGKSDKTDLSNVTIRQLLSHSAGLFRDGVAKQWVNDVFPAKLEGTVSSKSVVFENATTFKYSNHGYAVLGAIIEKVSKESYSDYVSKHIIKKLGLKSIIPDLTDEKPKKLVLGYERYLPDQSYRSPEPHVKTNAYAPATGFISDVKDLAVFLSALNLESKKPLLSRESKKEMMRVHGIPEDDEMYGLGLVLNKVSNHQLYGHSGGFAGFTTNAICEPNDNIQVIVLTNTLSGTAWNVSNSIMELIYKLADMKDVKFVAKEPYSGVYRCRWGDTTVVSLGKDLVEFVSNTNNPAKSWGELSKKKTQLFVDSQKSGYGSPGEESKFSKIKNGKAQEFSTNGAVWRRLSDSLL